MKGGIRAPAKPSTAIQITTVPWNDERIFGPTLAASTATNRLNPMSLRNARAPSLVGPPNAGFRVRSHEMKIPMSMQPAEVPNAKGIPDIWTLAWPMTNPSVKATAMNDTSV